jgi:manganese oxidase
MQRAPVASCFPVFLALVTVVVAGVASVPAGAQAPAPVIAATQQASEDIVLNDNREPAGELHGGVLTLRLVARNGTWHPEGPASNLAVAAWGEEGRPLQNPGPLIRVPQGTEVHVSVRNALATPLTVFGLGARRGIADDSVTIAAGGIRELRFTAGDPGIYYYAGKTTPAPVLARNDEDSQLNGAIVVDPAGAEPRPRDQVFVISWWFRPDSTALSGLSPGTVLAINGASWPHTERFDLVQGDSVQWRWINIVPLAHPLHLHGFYFRVDGTGDGAQFQTLAPDQQRQAVTETIAAGGTMSLAWAPTRPGNWIFHCHFASHMSSLEALNSDRRMPAAGHAAHGGASMQHSMGGLVLGIRVRPRGVQMVPASEGRPIRLLVRSRAKVFGDYTGYSFVLGGSPQEAHPEVMTMPGPTLVLERGRRVAINIVNQSHEPAAIHWHGIELESFPDGVPGWSGDELATLPAIAPGDSLTVRFSTPRAGTFMYHSHFNEFQQIAAGLYGAIVVVEPGERYDPDSDRILLFSDAAPTLNLLQGPFPPALLNGKEHPEPMELQAGKRYRFRIVNIRTDSEVGLELRRDGAPVQWRLVAKDGADLPPSQATLRPATARFGAGEIFDVEFTPERAGAMELRFLDPGLPEPIPVTVVAVRVR